MAKFVCLVLILFTSFQAYGYTLPRTDASPEELYNFVHHCEIQNEAAKSSLNYTDFIALVIFSIPVITLSAMYLRGKKIVKNKYSRIALFVVAIIILSIGLITTIGGQLPKTFCTY